jgi:hypothetical protein
MLEGETAPLIASTSAPLRRSGLMAAVASKIPTIAAVRPSFGESGPSTIGTGGTTIADTNVRQAGRRSLLGLLTNALLFLRGLFGSRDGQIVLI